MDSPIERQCLSRVCRSRGGSYAWPPGCAQAGRAASAPGPNTKGIRVLKQIILLLTCCFVLVNPVAKAETGTLAKIMETGQITLRYRGNTPTFSYLTQDDVVEGFSIDLCRVIARSVQERLKLETLEIRYVPVTSENRLEAVADGSAASAAGTGSARASAIAR